MNTSGFRSRVSRFGCKVGLVVLAALPAAAFGWTSADVMAFYNRLTSPKSIVFVQNAQHGNRLQTEPTQKFQIVGADEIRVPDGKRAK